MSRREKIEYLRANHPRIWMGMQYDAWYWVKEQRKRKCVCGKPMSEEHIEDCRAFSKAVDNLAIEKLEHLLPNGQSKNSQKNIDNMNMEKEKFDGVISLVEEMEVEQQSILYLLLASNLSKAGLENVESRFAFQGGKCIVMSAVVNYQGKLVDG